MVTSPFCSYLLISVNTTSLSHASLLSKKDPLLFVEYVELNFRERRVLSSWKGFETCWLEFLISLCRWHGRNPHIILCMNTKERFFFPYTAILDAPVISIAFSALKGKKRILKHHPFWFFLVYQMGWAQHNDSTRSSLLRFPEAQVKAHILKDTL